MSRQSMRRGPTSRNARRDAIAAKQNGAESSGNLHVAIVGSRDWPDLPRVRRFVASLVRKHPDVVVVSGGARGVDQTAEEEALRHGCRVYSFRPRKRPDGLYEIVLFDRTADGETVAPCADGKLYPTFASAAHARNRAIVHHSQRVVAFNAGTSGTNGTVGIANEYGIAVHEYRPKVAA